MLLPTLSFLCRSNILIELLSIFEMRRGDEFAFARDFSRCPARSPPSSAASGPSHFSAGSMFNTASFHYVAPRHCPLPSSPLPLRLPANLSSSSSARRRQLLILLPPADACASRSIVLLPPCFPAFLLCVTGLHILLSNLSNGRPRHGRGSLD